MTQRIATILAFVTGLGMLFIGARFLIAPESAEAGYGLQFEQMGDNAFHYIKGIRDIFTGLLLCLLVLFKERRALGISLLTGAIIPVVDLLIVLSKSYNGFQQTIPHLSAVLICVAAGLILLVPKSQKTR